jgi:hypothetical protein
MTRIAIKYRDYKEAVAVRRLLKATNPEPYLI